MKLFRYKKEILSLFLILSLFGCDRLLKNYILNIKNLSLIDYNFFKFNLYLSFNENIAFGIPINKLLLYFVTTIIIGILLYLIYVFSQKKQYNLVLVIILILGGAVSNIMDRIYYKAVVDYLDFRFWDFIWPTFNIADAMIVSGALIWLYIDYKESKKHPKIF